MPRAYYKLLYRLSGSESFLLWYTDDADGVAVSEDGRVLSFGSDADVQAYAAAQSLPMVEERPVLHDLDMLASWLADPHADTVDPVAVLAAWNLFSDVARSCPAASAGFASFDHEFATLYEKVFWANNLPAVTPEGERFDPKWSPDEVSSLRAVLRAGLDVLTQQRATTRE